MVAGAAVVIAAVWILRSTHRNAPPNDCALVKQLGPQWTSMQHSVAQLGNGAGETQDLLKIADQESAMSDKIRATATSVSAAELKQQLTKWADGTALSASAQRDAARPPAESSSATNTDAAAIRSAQLTYDATAALRKACPALHI